MSSIAAIVDRCQKECGPVMSWKLDVLLVAAALLLGQVGLFYLAAYRCESSVLSVASAHHGLRALVVTDVHILGKRRRLWIERFWNDMQIASSLRAAVRVHQPDIVLVLGDQLDEGGFPTSDSDYESYASRFKAAFASTNGIETIYAIGNHDSAFGRFLSPAAIGRHERAFGLANSVIAVKGHTIVRLNTMALDTDVSDVEVQAQASSFLETLSREARHAPDAEQSMVLLSHFPLFRKDDMACGPERVREEGHITYEHPSFLYETHHHVLSESLSHDLLHKLQPDVVLSGHTHAWCAYEHRDTPSSAKEFTIPSLSWGQRPDPSYALLVVGGSSGASVTRCALPHEHVVLVLYGGTLAVLLTRLVWRGIAMMSRRQTRLQHHPKKLK